MKVKKVIVFLIVLLTIISISLISNASYLEKFSGDVGGDIATRAGKISSTALTVIQVIGMAVAVIMLIVLGIKYMVASAADRAEIKKHAIVYVTGAIIMFGAAGIVEIIKKLAVTFGA